MKFLYFGDLHERPTAPAHRKDDFHESISDKIKEIREIGKKHNVTAFLQPGDFLDQPKVDSTFLSEVMNRWGFSDIQQDLLGLAKGEVGENDIANKLKDQIPMIGAIGNHELYGNALKSYPKTSLAFLERVGFMHLPTKDKPFVFKDEDGLEVAITASHFHTQMDKPQHVDDYIVDHKHGDFHIHLVHGYLTNKDMGDMFLHTTVDDISKKTNADLTIAGHDHIGFKLLEADGKQFVNPGAVVRLSNDKKEIKRRPKVLLIEVTKDKGVKVKSIYLKSAKPGEDVLDRTHATFKESMSNKMEEIESLVNKSNVRSGISITDIIQAISESEKIDEDLKNRAIDAVTSKMKNIQKQPNAMSEYTIDKIVLENFQSHEHSEYTLKKGLNVFIGQSSSGKSAIQRALAWVYENDGVDPRRYIKAGKDFTKVSLYLSNGMVISRLVEKKRNGKNGYEVFTPNDGETAYYNTKSLPLIQEYLGFSYLQIDDKKTVPLNFQKQGMSWFFFGDGFTNSDRAKIIGAVYKTHYVDAVIKEMESDSKKFGTAIKEKKKDIETTAKEVEKFNYLPQMKKDIEIIEQRLAEVKMRQEKVLKAKGILEERKNIEQQIQKDRQVIQSLNKLEEAENRINELIQFEQKKNKIHSLANDLSDLTREYKVQENIAKSLIHIDKAAEKLQYLEKDMASLDLLKDKYQKMKNLEQEQAQIKTEIQKSKAVVNSYSNLDIAEQRVIELEQRVRVKLIAENLLVEFKEITQKGMFERKIINQLIAENIQLVESYQKTLLEVGACPLCQSNVNHKTIENLSKTYLLENKKESDRHVS